MSKSVASGHGQGALGLFLALAVLSGTACSPTNGEFERPELRIDNLVLVTIDTLRADHVGAIGYHRPTTPNLDRLARRSALFTQAIDSGRHPLAIAMKPGSPGARNKGKLLVHG